MTIAIRPSVGQDGAAYRSDLGNARSGKYLEKGLDREAALAATTRRYCELMQLGEPVHTWPVGLPTPVPLG